VADALPKLIAYRLLEPALHIPESVQIICHEDKAERLISEIPLHSIDLVLSDIPATPSIGARVFNHLLGECELAVFGVSAFFVRYANNFPASLNGAPLLMPTQNTALRRSLDQWLHTEGLCPEVKAEIEDSALLKTFASAGAGMFVAPTAVQTEIQRQYGCQIIGIVPSLYESFYAITAQRKLKHPAVMAILENTNNGLFL
jgi:LysR family transcriptional activator of nhaA